MPRGLRRTARKKLHAACQRLTEWSKHHRHLPGREFFQRLHARLRGHDNYSGVRGNSRSLNRFFHGAMDSTFKWLNRRGGKQSSYTWEQFPRVLDRVKRARPRITGGSTSESVCLKAGLCIAEASTTEEPDAGKLHVRDCTGGAG